MSNELRIKPSVAELEGRRATFECPFPSCRVILRGVGFLPSHFRKIHKCCIEGWTNSIYGHLEECYSLHCFCPVSGCKYSGQETKDRHFTSLKLLRQHFMKVHAEKKFSCEKCRLSFGLDRDRRIHEARCGIYSKCLDCESLYSTIEALKVHCYRKGHRMPEKLKKSIEMKTEETNLKSEKSTTSSSELNKNTTHVTPIAAVVLVNVTPRTEVGRAILSKSLAMKPILPKPSQCMIVQQPPTGNATPQSSTGPPLTNPAEHLNTDYLDAVSEGIQASIGDKNLDTVNNSVTNFEKSWSTTGIQTSLTFRPDRRKLIGTEVETQTVGDLILKKAMALADIPIQTESVGTQINSELNRKRISGTKCSNETQTLHSSPPKRRRRKNSLVKGISSVSDSMSQTCNEPRDKMDSTCQVDNFRPESGIVTLVDISKSSTSQGAQTDKFIRIDTMCQTKNQTVNECSQTSSDNRDQTSQTNPQRKANTSCKRKQLVQFITKVDNPGNSFLSDASTGPILSVQEQHVVEDKSINVNTEQEKDIESRECVDDDSSINKSQDMAIQTFEADFRKFLLAQCDSLVESDKQLQTEAIDQSKNSTSGVDQLLQMDTAVSSNEQGSSADFPINMQTQTVDLDPFETWMSNMETQTTGDTSFDSLSFTDIETQTMPSTSPKEAVSDSSTYNVSDFSLASIHTQTMNVADTLLDNSLSTQTDTDAFEDFQFDFPLTSIHTQTTDECIGDHVSTQTINQIIDVNQIGVGCNFDDMTVVQSANIETQTSDLSLSDTHTQTTWEEFDDLLRHFEK